MRIGIDIKAFKNGSTGIARYLRNIMDYLQKIDDTNEYFLFECTPSSYEIPNKKWTKILIPWRLPGIIWQQFILPNHLKKHSIDILWAPEQIAPVFYSGGTKIITTVHDLVIYRYPESCQKSNLYIQKWLLPFSLKKSAAIVPVSGYVKNELLEKFEFLKNKIIEVVTNAGPDWKIPSDYKREKRKNFLLCVGNIEPRKNLIRLVKAFEKIDDSNLKLVIVGPKGWNNTEFFSFIGNSPKRDLIEIKGFISEDELKSLYLSCKALVYPSIYEGFGIPVLEALTMDCPVLTSKGTVMEEIAKNSAFYFDPFDVDSISTMINSHLQTVRNYENIIQSYSWKNSAQLLLKIFETLK